ncbi:TPA: HEPN domain-containing protein [Legionella pneumophila]|nr:HEPN domain-containing protein [Legionella pneumophila]
MKIDTFLNDFAIRSFRSQADMDYIMARCAYRKGFFGQYHWSGLQAIEKYIKAILLFNRIPSIKMGHDLSKGLELLQNISFIKLENITNEIIQHFDAFGCNRYLTYSYVEIDYYLGNFDFAIWDIRKYCKSLNSKYSSKEDELTQEQLLTIENSSIYDTKSAYIQGGFIEEILQNKKHPARKDLIWQNPCFLSKNRKTVKQSLSLNCVNSPLTLHPEHLDDLIRYVKLSKQ